ncbi:MAG: glycosyltransferase [Bellilinea sp.]
MEVHKECIVIIVCVHNALDDVQKCLESILAFTTDPFTVIIVDDGSDDPTKDFLISFASAEARCSLIRNETAKGYTFAANIGMKASQSPYFVLLNSDTLVGPEWIDRMYRAMNIENKHGVVGPLSNTASWQSVPNLSDNGDWAANVLPKNITASDMSKLVAKYSGCIFPEVPLLNGFCLMVRKDVTNEIGYFDEENFGQGYGEEDDFNLRAESTGWKKVIADDVYIYHSQSKSYSHSRRYNLSRVSGEKLRLKHGTEKIAESVAFMNPNRIVEGIRSRADVLFEREGVIELGRNNYSGKRLLFILPIIDAGGGANVIIDEARCMLKMGVDVSIFNLAEYKTGFLKSYPHIDIPLVFGETKDLNKISSAYDAVIASANYSVEWLRPLEGKNVILGYYIQGFEPLMYPEDSTNARQALSTYTMIDNCKRFTKTEWTRQMVRSHTGVDSDIVGVSVNTDLFRPRDTISFGKKPVRISAMIRPGSPYRNPIMTLSLLKKIEEKYGNKVQIWLFGANDVRDIVDSKYLDFNWKQFGKLTQYQVASMMSKADIFTDFSSHQAMGLTALEAMSAGCSVIVPKNGGATEFVKDRKNGIVVDTSNFQSSLHALDELVEDDNLRKDLQLAAIRDVVHYYPEKASLQILNSLFKDKD